MMTILLWVFIIIPLWVIISFIYIWINQFLLNLYSMTLTLIIAIYAFIFGGIFNFIKKLTKR